MKLKNRMALGLGAAVLLTAAACTAGDTGDAGTSVSPSQPAEEDAERTLSLLTTFVDADGAPLTGVTIRVDDGAGQLDYALDAEGSLTLAGLSPTATLELTDAVQEEDGSVSLWVASDARTVSLVFTLEDGGQLRCALATAEDAAQ